MILFLAQSEVEDRCEVLLRYRLIRDFQDSHHVFSDDVVEGRHGLKDGFESRRVVDVKPKGLELRSLKKS